MSNGAGPSSGRLSFGFKPAAIKATGSGKAAGASGGLSFGKPAVSSTAARNGQATKASTAGKARVFGGDDDEEDEDVFKTTKTKAGAPVVAMASKMTKAQREQQQAQLEMDANVFAYDEVYDSMKESTRVAEAKRKQEAGDRKPKYIGKLMETAAQRQLDRARAEDKMIAKEREREGDMYADKEAFTTDSYLKQQEELREAEEEDAKKEAGGGKKGLATFLKEYLDTTSALHEAAVQGAATASQAGDKRVFTVAPPPKEKTDVQIAAEVEAQTGRKVQLNEDGQIVDHRELMSGGLNVSKPKKAGARPGGFALSITEREAADKAKEPERTAVNTADARERARKSRERHSRLVEQQMLELEKKRKAEEDLKRDEAVKKLAKRNDGDRIAEAKRRAEERRREREAQAKAIVNVVEED